MIISLCSLKKRFVGLNSMFFIRFGTFLGLTWGIWGCRSQCRTFQVSQTIILQCKYTPLRLQCIYTPLRLQCIFKTLRLQCIYTPLRLQYIYTSLTHQCIFTPLRLQCIYTPLRLESILNFCCVCMLYVVCLSVTFLLPW